MNNSEYTTYLIRNIPRKEWKKVRMLCLDKGVKLNDLMLDIVRRISAEKLIGKTILQLNDVEKYLKKVANNVE